MRLVLPSRGVAPQEVCVCESLPASKDTNNARQFFTLDRPQFLKNLNAGGQDSLARVLANEDRAPGR